MAKVPTKFYVVARRTGGSIEIYQDGRSPFPIYPTYEAAFPVANSLHDDDGGHGGHPRGPWKVYRMRIEEVLSPVGNRASRS